MNWFIIIGIVIIGVGTYCMYLGSDLNSKKSQTDIIDRIEQTQAQINDLKELPPGEDKKKDLLKLDNEFQNWAKEFLKHKEAKKITNQKENINFSEQLLETSRIHLPAFKKFFQTIENALVAYNLETNKEILFNIPQVHDDIMTMNKKNYKANIVFNNNISWELTIDSPKSHENNYSPAINVAVYDSDVTKLSDIEKFTQRRDRIIIHTLENKLLITIYENTKTNFRSLKKEHQVKDLSVSTQELAISLLEMQLLQL